MSAALTHTDGWLNVVTRMRPILRVVLVIVGIVAFRPAVAGERLVVRSIDLSGAALPARATEVRSDFVGGIAAAGFDVVPDEALKKALDETPELASCTSDVCLASIGKSLGARWALAAVIEVISLSNVHVTARIVDAKTGKVAATFDKGCEGPCTWDENKNLVSSAGPSLRSQLESLIALETASAGGPALVVVAPVDTGPTKLEWGLRIAAIGSGALAVAGFIVGGVEASRSNQSDCSGAFPDAYCMRRLDTGTGQAFGFATGSIFLVASGVLAYFGWRHSHRTGVTATSSRGAALLSWSY